MTQIASHFILVYSISLVKFPTKIKVNNPISTKNRFEYRVAVESILSELRRERDREIISRRFGFGLKKRQTLERIGNDFNITRERVRQIEKASIAKMVSSNAKELIMANEIITTAVIGLGNVALISEVAAALDIPASEESYVIFLTLLSPGVELIDENDELRASAAIQPIFNRSQTQALINELINTIKEYGNPIESRKLQSLVASQLELKTLEQLLIMSKNIAYFDGKWGLIAWPEVNPKSIRDKTYLVLSRHGQPLHFSDIANQISELQANISAGKKDVTIQAVHNELIKDTRFILIGRGIYALAEWGYTPGTVADIITGILKEESPLHKDVIIDRVLRKRQVKTTTIILNLQEKNQFIRTSKATYALKVNK